MQEETMKNRMIFSSLGAAAGGTLAFIFIASPAPAQTATGQTTTGQPTTGQPTTGQPTATAPAIARKKPTSATPRMIDEAIQRTQARAAKAAATGKPEEFGSEEPFTYVPGRTF
jgi:hypothetical protein